MERVTHLHPIYPRSNAIARIFARAQGLGDRILQEIKYGCDLSFHDDS